MIWYMRQKQQAHGRAFKLYLGKSYAGDLELDIWRQGA